MDISHVITLSFVEGVTEFLPISSTAHLILTSHLLGIPKSEFLTTFEVSIQLGAIGSVVYLYWDRIKKERQLFLKACIGFIPTGLVGFTIYKWIKPLLSDPFIPVLTLFVGGIVIIIIEKIFSKRLETQNEKKLTYKTAFLIGLFQAVSMVPGVSRAAASIFGGMSMGLSRKTAVDFAFLLAIPTMLAATSFDLLQTASTLSQNELGLICVGILLSFLSALFVVKWLIRFVQTNNFFWFGVYRIIISMLYYFFFLK